MNQNETNLERKQPRRRSGGAALCDRGPYTEPPRVMWRRIPLMHSNPVTQASVTVT